MKIYISVVNNFFIYLDPSYVPNDDESFHVLNVHINYHQWQFDCQSVELIQEYDALMASLANFYSYFHVLFLPSIWVELMKLMIKHLTNFDGKLDPTVQPVSLTIHDEFHHSSRDSKKKNILIVHHVGSHKINMHLPYIHPLSFSIQ